MTVTCKIYTIFTFFLEMLAWSRKLWNLDCLFIRNKYPNCDYFCDSVICNFFLILFKGTKKMSYLEIEINAHNFYIFFLFSRQLLKSTFFIQF